MVVCCVTGCLSNSKDGEQKFYVIPKSRIAVWLKAINKDVNVKSSVCSKHFITGQPHTDPFHTDYIPTISMGGEIQQSDLNLRLKHYEELNQKDGQELIENKNTELLIKDECNDELFESNPTTSTAATIDDDKTTVENFIAPKTKTLTFNKHTSSKASKSKPQLVQIKEGDKITNYYIQPSNDGSGNNLQETKRLVQNILSTKHISSSNSKEPATLSRIAKESPYPLQVEPKVSSSDSENESEFSSESDLVYDSYNNQSTVIEVINEKQVNQDDLENRLDSIEQDPNDILCGIASCKLFKTSLQQWLDQKCEIHETYHHSCKCERPYSLKTKIATEVEGNIPGTKIRIKITVCCRHLAPKKHPDEKDLTLILPASFETDALLAHGPTMLNPKGALRCYVPECTSSEKHLAKWIEERKAEGASEGSIVQPYYFIAFPPDGSKRRTWLENIMRFDKDKKDFVEPKYNERVCSKHFKDPSARHKLPTLKIPRPSVDVLNAVLKYKIHKSKSEGVAKAAKRRKRNFTEATDAELKANPNDPHKMLYLPPGLTEEDVVYQIPVEHLEEQEDIYTDVLDADTKLNKAVLKIRERESSSPQKIKYAYNTLPILNISPIDGKITIDEISNKSFNVIGKVSVEDIDDEFLWEDIKPAHMFDQDCKVQCPHCAKTFLSLELMEKHILLHNSYRPSLVEKGE